MPAARHGANRRWQMQAQRPTFRVMREDGWSQVLHCVLNPATSCRKVCFPLRENLLLERPPTRPALPGFPDASRPHRMAVIRCWFRRCKTLPWRDRLGITVQQAAHAWVDAHCSAGAEASFG